MNVRISNIKTVNELPDYWSSVDYINLLKELDVLGVDNINPKDLKEMLYMAISDLDPKEAAQIVLAYKLGNVLSDGQIQAIAHEMMEDKIAEEYPDTSLHYDLFNINQLLFKAFYGAFPNTEATILTIEIEDDDIDIDDEEIIAKIIGGGLKERSLIKRLLLDQLNGNAPFGDAGKFIWKIDMLKRNRFEITTSKYWLDKEDIQSMEYEIHIKRYEIEQS